jgi:hypothetical protein
MVGGGMFGPITLRAPKLEGARGIFPPRYMDSPPPEAKFLKSKNADYFVI